MKERLAYIFHTLIYTVMAFLLVLYLLLFGLWLDLPFFIWKGTSPFRKMDNAICGYYKKHIASSRIWREQWDL